MFYVKIKEEIANTFALILSVNILCEGELKPLYSSGSGH
jgi:hypothetical protein